MVFRVRVDENAIYDVDVEAEDKYQAEEIARSACKERRMDMFTELRWIRAKAQYAVDGAVSNL